MAKSVDKVLMQPSIHPSLTNELFWDPFLHKDNIPTRECLLRIRREIKSLYEDPPPNIFVVPDEKDITVIHALIAGTFDTPYEGGFFYFLLKFPGSYPLVPPWVKFMTTDGGTVRLNPNLYKNGKVCLSMLGTWPGPGWSPAITLTTCLISIQSLLGEKPYHNEPGYEKEKVIGDSHRYNEVIQHETLRVAVCGMIENETGIVMPQPLIDFMEKTFLKLYNIYEGIALKKLHLDNQKMQDPFGEKRGVYQYKSLLRRLQECKQKLLLKSKALKDNMVDCDSSSSTSDLDDPPSQLESPSTESPSKTEITNI